VYYVIDPQLGQGEAHNYRTDQEEVVAASAQIRASNGIVRMTMWSDFNNYLNAVIDSSEDSRSAPSLYHSTSPDRDAYNALVNGIRSRNVYEIRGSFATEPCNNCETLEAPRLILLDGGTGLSDGRPMNDGNFQVEGYCGTGAMSNYPNVDYDNDNWYCINSNNERYVLEKADFDQICRFTYNNSMAFALPDANNPIDAFNWRCYSSG
jgi:hypothetical protein